MLSNAHQNLVDGIRNHAIRLTGGNADCTRLFELIDGARFVFIGESTHGTEEFYRLRAEITKKLIRYHGFTAVAVEADWPDAYHVNRYARGNLDIKNDDAALSKFERFPQWMWRNDVMLEFTKWLREHNQQRSQNEKIGFYGLDIYSLRASIQAVIQYLKTVDPAAAERAQHYYGCFERFNESDGEEYGLRANLNLEESYQHEAIQQLIALRARQFDYLRQEGFMAEEEYFYAEQNAKIIVNAEKYYRALFETRTESWNLRDRHMMDTLSALAAHLTDQRFIPAKIIVWAHNSHIGDGRATELGQTGEWNLGQLAREYYGTSDTILIGFSTYSGTVTAASHWNGVAECKTLLPALPESYEALFHETGMENFLLPLRGNDTLLRHLDINRLQRAIGVVYAPETERRSHYFFSRLPHQFDAIIHLDKTKALQPLDCPLWHADSKSCNDQLTG